MIMQDIWITDLMTQDVISCSSGTPLNDVVAELHQQRFSCLLIVDDNIPVGIITERDMVTILADMLGDVSWDALAVENFMSTPVISVSEDLNLYQAVEIFREKTIRHAPVVNRNGELIGLLTQTDIINGCYEQYLRH